MKIGIQNAEDVATTWYEFLNTKFRPTVTEQGRELEELPLAQGDMFTEKKIQEDLVKMSTGKSCGLDGMPTTVFKDSALCNKLLIELLQKIWYTEEIPREIPNDFAKASFVMLFIFKNKGISNSPAKYRCIGLLNHMYKILSQ